MDDITFSVETLRVRTGKGEYTVSVPVRQGKTYRDDRARYLVKTYDQIVSMHHTDGMTQGDRMNLAGQLRTAFDVDTSPEYLLSTNRLRFLVKRFFHPSTNQYSVIIGDQLTGLSAESSFTDEFLLESYFGYEEPTASERAFRYAAKAFVEKHRGQYCENPWPHLMGSFSKHRFDGENILPPSTETRDEFNYERVACQVMGSLPGLSKIVVCPDVSCGRSEDRTPSSNSISSIIMHLNDYHKWKREEIADWLDTLDVDLAFGGEVKVND